MSVDEGAARRVAGAAASQDTLLARDLLAAVKDYLAGWGDPETLDHWTPEIPRLRRLYAFRDSLVSEVGDEEVETMHAFVVVTPEVEKRGLTEADAREAVREYVYAHGEEMTRRDVSVRLDIEAIGTSHTLAVERFF